MQCMWVNLMRNEKIAQREIRSELHVAASVPYFSGPSCEDCSMNASHAHSKLEEGFCHH